MPIVFAAIAPHGDLAIPELCDPGIRDLAAATQAGMRGLETRARAARPDLVVVLSPHNVHIEGAMAVVTSGRIAGSLGEADRRIDLDCAVDRSFARRLLDGLATAGIPASGISYGGNVAEEAVMPMDWSTLIPLWYLGGRWDPAPPVVVIAPARDLPPVAHVAAGSIIASLGAESPQRIALIASADQAHTHALSGPYGVDPAAPVFDQLVVDAVKANNLGRLLDISDELIEAAKPDAWWQLLMLHGALRAQTDHWLADLLSYEAPTYYGMLCAAFLRSTTAPAPEARPNG